MYIQYTLAFQDPRMMNEINMWTYMLNRCPFWHHHSNVSYSCYFYCLDLVVSTSKNWSTALSHCRGCKLYLQKLYQRLKPHKITQDLTQDSPMWINIVGMNHRNHKWITHMWGQISMALPSLVIKCQFHHKLRVIMERHGANNSSHVYTVQTHVFHRFGAHGICKITCTQS